MGLSTTGHYQRWREGARWGGTSEDRYTELWGEMLKAYRAHLDSLTVPSTNQDTGISIGMVRAYCLITGENTTSVYRMLGQAARELVPS